MPNRHLSPRPDCRTVRSPHHALTHCPCSAWRLRCAQAGRSGGTDRADSTMSTTPRARHTGSARCRRHVTPNCHQLQRTSIDSSSTCICAFAFTMGGRAGRRDRMPAAAFTMLTTTHARRRGRLDRDGPTTLDSYWLQMPTTESLEAQRQFVTSTTGCDAMLGH